MRLFIRRLGASRPCDWVTSLFLSFLLSKGLVGQTEWSQHFPECGGTSQSPVDVVSTQTKYDPGLIPITPLGYSQLGHRPFTLYNNGHTGKYDNQAGIQAALRVICLYCPILSCNLAVNLLLHINKFSRYWRLCVISLVVLGVQLSSPSLFY